MRSPSSRSAATFTEAAIALVLFGCIPVVVKFVSANPYTIGVFRLAVATAGLYLLVGKRSRLSELSASDIRRLAVIGAIFFAHWLTYFLAIKLSSASVGAIGLSTYGVDLLLLGAITGRSRLNAIDIVAVLMAMAGAVATVPELTLKNDAAIGMLLACVSAFFYALLPILHQRYAHMPSETRALGQFGFALALFLLFLPKTEWDLRPVDWAGLAFLAVGSTLIGHSFWVRVTTVLSPSLTSIIYYGNVPIALLLSVLVLREPLTPRLLLGAALIVGGGILGLASHGRLKRTA